VLGGFGLGNFGDDLLMIATVRVLQRVYRVEDLAVLVYPGGERYAPRLEPNCRYIERRSGLSVSADVTVLGGGTQFYGFGGPPLRRSTWERGIRFLQGIRSGHMTWRNLWSPTGRGVELVHGGVQIAVSLGLGPFKDRAAEDRARTAVGQCQFLAVRDESSLEYCRRWGLDHARLRGDWGFARALWTDDGQAPVHAPSGRRVGFVIRDWYKSTEGLAHIKAAIELARLLRNRGDDVVFFLFDGHDDTTCRRSVRRARLPLEVWWPQRMQVREQLEKLSTCELLVTSRAHGAIVGAVLGIPSLCIAIEPKLEIMARMLGPAAECWSPPFSSEEGLAAVTRFRQRLPEASRAALEVSRQQAASAMQAADELVTFLESTTWQRQ
jgi:polysaccharide pyruvyl transferase WcaK-like protein